MAVIFGGVRFLLVGVQRGDILGRSSCSYYTCGMNFQHVAFVLFRDSCMGEDKRVVYTSGGEGWG